MKQIEGF